MCGEGSRRSFEQSEQGAREVEKGTRREEGALGVEVESRKEGEKCGRKHLSAH